MNEVKDLLIYSAMGEKWYLSTGNNYKAIVPKDYGFIFEVNEKIYIETSMDDVLDVITTELQEKELQLLTLCIPINYAGQDEMTCTALYGGDTVHTRDISFGILSPTTLEYLAMLTENNFSTLPRNMASNLLYYTTDLEKFIKISPVDIFE